jgi:hypothetical protein
MKWTAEPCCLNNGADAGAPLKKPAMTGLCLLVARGCRFEDVRTSIVIGAEWRTFIRWEFYRL